MPQNDQDPISKFNEWQDHQYNPGYWVNRFSPLFPLRRLTGFFLLSLFDLFILVPAFFCVSYIHFFVEVTAFSIPVLLILGAASIVSILRTLRTKPPVAQMTQQEQEKINRAENKAQRKKLPKRPKNYK